MKKLVMIISILVFSIPVSGQTIHKDDMLRFYGSFAIDSTVEVNRGRGGKPAPIITEQFVEWFVLSPDEKDRLTAKHRRANPDLYRNRHWVCYKNYFDKQSVKASITGQNTPRKIFDKFVMLSDCFGFESSRNIMTIWKRVERDSLRFKCAVTGSFDVGIGSTAIEFVTLMPDSSIMIIVKNSGGDGGDWWGNYRFLIETEDCHFQEFYSRYWNFNNNDFENLYSIYYLYGMMGGNSYKFLEINEYYHYSKDKMTGMMAEKFPDSNVVKTLDLEELIDDFRKK